MEANEILARANADSAPPSGWSVFSLDRRGLLTGLAGWFFGVVISIAILLLIAPAVIPSNYHAVVPAILSTVLLGFLLFVALGSLYFLITDGLRFLHPDRYIVVFTDTDFVKSAGSKIIQVPLTCVTNVIARGQEPADLLAAAQEQAEADRNVTSVGNYMTGFFLGRGTTDANLKKKKSRVPPSLAFIDSRTDTRVVVVNDATYGNPFQIADLLNEHCIYAQSEAERQNSTARDAE